MDTLVSNETFGSLFDELAGRWVGCDWRTEFGPGRLNLQAMTAEQAALLGRATGGWESFQWREAARFLAHVEADAKAARRAAELARDHAIAGQLPLALEHAHRACELERRYHANPGWEPLEAAIQQRMVHAVEACPSLHAAGDAQCVPTAG